jgi:16S rRNA (cytosine967-C5)-methyltransferase
VKPGGTLVFATCSLEPQEGEKQLARFLAASSRLRDRSDPRGRTARRRHRRAMDGTLRLLPGMLADKGGMDGFFIADCAGS